MSTQILELSCVNKKQIEMKNLLIFLLVTCYSMQMALGQEKCISKENNLVDVNSVNKCLIEKKEEKINNKETSFIATASTRRHVKRRVYFEKVTSLTSDLKSKNTIDTSVLKKNDLEFCYLNNVAPLVKSIKIKEVGVLFDVVDEIPMFQTCISSSINKVDCFNYEMQRHIVQTLIYPEEALDKGLEGEVKVSFVIDETGKVTNLKTEGDDVAEVLKEEAKRIILLLPDFNPGKHNGEFSKVLYSFPMSFTLTPVSD